MIIPPVANQNAGKASGGGILDSLTGGSSGAPKQSDGSVGLFDGVLKKALFGAAAGVGIGFLPFLPGGPLLGGVVGALAGAGFGMFQNFMKMKKIREENAAILQQLGYQPQTQEEAQALLSGNVGGIVQGQAGASQIGQGTAQQVQQPIGGTGQVGATGQAAQTGLVPINQTINQPLPQVSTTDPFLQGIGNFTPIDTSFNVKYVQAGGFSPGQGDTPVPDQAGKVDDDGTDQADPKQGGVAGQEGGLVFQQCPMLDATTPPKVETPPVQQDTAPPVEQEPVETKGGEPVEQEPMVVTSTPVKGGATTPTPVVEPAPVKQGGKGGSGGDVVQQAVSQRRTLRAAMRTRLQELRAEWQQASPEQRARIRQEIRDERARMITRLQQLHTELVFARHRAELLAQQGGSATIGPAKGGVVQQVA